MLILSTFAPQTYESDGISHIFAMCWSSYTKSNRATVHQYSFSHTVAP